VASVPGIYDHVANMDTICTRAITKTSFIDMNMGMGHHAIKRKVHSVGHGIRPLNNI
jgi:hypothetical protein